MVFESPQVSTPLEPEAGSDCGILARESISDKLKSHEKQGNYDIIKGVPESGNLTTRKVILRARLVQRF
jgi:hypothetical protein